mgnify:CR=1 FL=1
MGKITSEILSRHGVEVVILDNSSENVKRLRYRGIKAFLGDGSDSKLLTKAGIETAKIIIITTSDIQKSVNLTHFIINKYPDKKLIVSAVNLEHLKTLNSYDVHEIILETYYSSLNLGEKVLEELGESISEINKTIKQFHDSGIEQILNEPKT